MGCLQGKTVPFAREMASRIPCVLGSLDRALRLLVLLVCAAQVDAGQQLSIWTFDSLSGVANGSTVGATTEMVDGTPLVTIRNSDIYASGGTGVAYTDTLGVPHSATKAFGWSDFKKKGQSVDGQLDIALDATGFSTLALRFDYKHSNDNDSTANQLEWLYSNDGGGTWSAATLFTVTDDNAWHSRTIILPSTVDGRANLVIRIQKYAGDSDDTEVNKILIVDNLEITGDSGSGPGQGPVITPVNIPPVPSANPVVLCGAISDTADASRSNIVLSVADPDTADAQLNALAGSSAPSVATASVVRHTDGSNDTFQVILQPLAVGYADLTITISDPQTNRATYTIQYAVSAASSTPAASRYFSGSSDASAAIGLDADWVLVADDENEVIRLFNRHTSGPPFKTFDFSGHLGLAKEADFEAALRIGNRIYWVGSHGNDKTGNAEPTRNTIFAADVSGSGTNITLAYVNKFVHLKDNLIAWDNANGHGLGAAALGLSDSAATGIPCDDPDGFNIEAAAVLDGKVYIGFRTPLENTSNRNLALVVPVVNFAAVVDAGSGTMVFGAPVFLDLGGRGLRDLAPTAAGDLLLLAGPSDETTTPSFEFYQWNGVASSKPVRLSSSLGSVAIDGGGRPEAIIGPVDAISFGSQVQVIQDNGITIYYNDGISGKDLGTRQFAKERCDLLTIGQQRVVTTADDEDNVVPGTGVSLREAIAAAVFPDRIGFASTLDGATLVLTNGEIALAADITVDTDGLTGGLTVSGNQATRVFRVLPGVHATLRYLSITGGQGSQGGGFFNNGGTLALSHCTLAGNSADGQGGAIYAVTGSTFLANCTLSGNTANQGGAIANASGSLFLNHVTVSSNRASAWAGGVWIGAGAASLTNTIIAGNAAPADADIQGAFGGTGNLTSGAPGLAPLAYYGGATKTMPPLPGSPAIDTAGAATLLLDQRGEERPRGLLPDIGAVEAFPLSSLALLDTDVDGIDDRLEPAYGLVVGGDDTAADSDGDGHSDAVELANMTDPLDPESALRIVHFAPVPTNPAVFTVSFQTFPGLAYELESSRELPAFAPVADSCFTAVTDTVTVNVPFTPGPERGFVRLIRR